MEQQQIYQLKLSVLSILAQVNAPYDSLVSDAEPIYQWLIEEAKATEEAKNAIKVGAQNIAI